MEKKIKLIIAEFLVHLGIDFEDIEVVKKDEKSFRVNAISTEPSLLIGHHGENLQAMQKIVKVMMHEQFGEDLTVMFDVDNYRNRQEENVLAIAKQKIEEVRRTKHQVALPPMSPYFRRTIHMFVRDGAYSDISTESIGQGNYRQIVLKYKK